MTLSFATHNPLKYPHLPLALCTCIAGSFSLSHLNAVWGFWSCEVGKGHAVSLEQARQSDYIEREIDVACPHLSHFGRLGWDVEGAGWGGAWRVLEWGLEAQMQFF